MKHSKLLLGLMAATAVTAAHAVAVTDTVDSGNYFVPSDAQKYDTPYYRGNGDDWSWQHSAIAGGSFSSATLSISAFDVDADQGEVDKIYAKDGSNWVLLGSLGGGNDVWSYTSFSLGSNFYDDIASGLQVKIAIDTTDSGWDVTLAKSVLSLDNGALPPAAPVPEPETYAMMLAGLGLIGVIARRRRQTAA